MTIFTRPTSLAPSLLGATALAICTPALAQDAEGPGTDPIVVTGEIDREIDAGEANRQARAITPRGTTIGQPLARFQTAICPGVWGLDGESAHFIIDRIYYNAENAGLELNEAAGCAANVIVAFVTEPLEEFNDMRAHDHHLLNGLTFWEKKAVSETEGPVLVWNAVSTRTTGGQARSGNPPSFESTQTSRLNAGSRRDLEMSVVMIDSDLLEDLDALALADYVTMRVLARTNPPGVDDVNYGTVLSLFSDPVNAPQQLTEFDRAYLTTLYSGRANTPGNMALRGVGDVMEREAEEQAE